MENNDIVMIPEKGMVEIDIEKANKIFIDDDGTKASEITEIMCLLNKYKGNGKQSTIVIDYGDFLKIAKSYLDMFNDLALLQDLIYKEFDD